MANRQSRRSVSLNRRIHDAAKAIAEQRNMTLAAFVESALVQAGVPPVVHTQQPLAQVKQHPLYKQQASPDRPPRLPSAERLMLGDEIADRMGFA